ncbi:6101_t:CDS:2 [Dentiscutata erythropus]|uniref:6101_t:CDS:1 n=1 Tax=Dentiscutata erythropus TaxID=1348616 RepID=A0A9N9FZR2_9GLOM|nr:6101_t:CDS:2 [Dentiscutata erythropus]
MATYVRRKAISIDSIDKNEKKREHEVNSPEVITPIPVRPTISQLIDIRPRVSPRNVRSFAKVKKPKFDNPDNISVNDDNNCDNSHSVVKNCSSTVNNSQHIEKNAGNTTHQDTDESLAKFNETSSPQEITRVTLTSFVKVGGNKDNPLTTHDITTPDPTQDTTHDATDNKKHDLKRHINGIHNEQREFLCPQCNKNFSRKDAWKRHELTCSSVEETKDAEKRKNITKSLPQLLPTPFTNNSDHPPPLTKRRGRPRKFVTNNDADLIDSTKEVAAEFEKRGRPKKIPKIETSSIESTEEAKVEKREGPTNDSSSVEHYAMSEEMTEETFEDKSIERRILICF